VAAVAVSTEDLRALPPPPQPPPPLAGAAGAEAALTAGVDSMVLTLVIHSITGSSMIVLYCSSLKTQIGKVSSVGVLLVELFSTSLRHNVGGEVSHA
jgi:hypothetical protein